MSNLNNYLNNLHNLKPIQEKERETEAKISELHRSSERQREVPETTRRGKSFGASSSREKLGLGAKKICFFINYSQGSSKIKCFGEKIFHFI